MTILDLEIFLLDYEVLMDQLNATQLDLFFQIKLNYGRSTYKSLIEKFIEQKKKLLKLKKPLIKILVIYAIQ